MNKSFEGLLQIPGSREYNTYVEDQMLAKKIFEMTIGFHLWLILSFTKQEEKAKVELEALG